MNDTSPLTLISTAYLNLLRVSHNSESRLRIQGALYECRGEIARITGRSWQSIQDEFEAASLTSGQPGND